MGLYIILARLHKKDGYPEAAVLNFHHLRCIRTFSSSLLK